MNAANSAFLQTVNINGNESSIKRGQLLKMTSHCNKYTDEEIRPVRVFAIN